MKAHPGVREMTEMEEMDERRGRVSTGLLALAMVVTAVVGIALVTRLLGIDQEPLHDEIYNFLAARSWLERGDLSILPGATPYTRAEIFTRTIATVMSVFGPTLAAARLTSVLVGTALAGTLAWWLSRNGLLVAGAVAGILVALDPQLLQLSQISRFYAVQHLSFFVAALAFAAAVETKRFSRVVGFGLLAVAALLVSLNMQVISIIGVAGLGLYAIVWKDSWIHIFLRRRLERHPIATPVVIGAVVVVFTLVAWLSGMVSAMLAMASYADVWAEAARDNVRYYYAWLHDHYAPLTVLFPLLLLLSWIRAPRITTLSICVFGVAFVAHSLMAWKTHRYLAYALPFFFTIGSIGCVEGACRLRAALPVMLTRAHVPARAVSFASLAVFAAVIASFAIGDRSFLISARILTRDPATHFPLMGERDGELSWSLAEPVLDTLVTDDRTLVSSNPLKAVLFLDRLDYILSLSPLTGPDGDQEEFWTDPRFDRPVIISAGALASLRCASDALVIVEDVKWRNRIVFPQGTVDYLTTNGVPVELPARTGIRAFLLNADDGPSCGQSSRPLQVDDVGEVDDPRLTGAVVRSDSAA